MRNERRKNREKRINRNINLIVMSAIILSIIVIAITSKGSYAYFTNGDVILPQMSGSTPVYSTLTINYTDHSNSQVINDGVTIYFDISGYLTADGNWNSPIPCIYYSIYNSSAVQVRQSSWTDYSMKLRFDSISTITPTDMSKVTYSQSVNSVVTNTAGSTGGVTWSGCWIKYKITNANFNLNSGESRNIIIHRSTVPNDQTANNMAISASAKEVYIKAKAYNADGGGNNSNYDWQKLEISY